MIPLYMKVFIFPLAVFKIISLSLILDGFIMSWKRLFCIEILGELRAYEHGCSNISQTLGSSQSLFL